MREKIITIFQLVATAIFGLVIPFIYGWVIGGNIGKILTDLVYLMEDQK